MLIGARASRRPLGTVRIKRAKRSLLSNSQSSRISVARNGEAYGHRSDHGVLELNAMAQVETGRLSHRPTVVVFCRMLDAKLAQEADRQSAFHAIGSTLDRLHPDHGSNGELLST